MKQRIRHLFPHNAGIPNDDQVPRGWITPQGHFHKTKEHWTSINAQFRRPDTRAVGKDEAPEEAELAEKNAHLAYSLGWISVGHAGKLNAIGHQKTFEASYHPAVTTLRTLLAALPHLSIQIEIQIGNYVPSRGTHEDFHVKEYDLDILIKRGRLRHTFP
ncbi:hypothetical protein WDW37_02205 [Bdellovibrionota bacterium FG-1]